MSVNFKNKKDFGLKVRGDDLRAQDTAQIKGGSVVIGDRWVPLGDLRIDVKKLVSDYMSTTSRRIFNSRGDVMYVLVCLDVYGTPKVIPSLSMNRRNYGDIKVFPDLSGYLPLMLVKLRHDGSENLKAMLPITEKDIEQYTGYGNFTTRGLRGATGFPGVTGYQGITGQSGITGVDGVTGPQGVTGLVGYVSIGVTGLQGIPGVSIPAYQSSITSYVQDVVDSSVNTWNDTVNDSEDTVQDTV